MNKKKKGKKGPKRHRWTEEEIKVHEELMAKEMERFPKKPQPRHPFDHPVGPIRVLAN